MKKIIFGVFMVLSGSLVQARASLANPWGNVQELAMTKSNSSWAGTEMDGVWTCIKCLIKICDEWGEGCGGCAAQCGLK